MPSSAMYSTSMLDLRTSIILSPKFPITIWLGPSIASARAKWRTCETVEEIRIPVVGYLGISTKEAPDAIQDAGLLDTVADLDDVAPFVNFSIILVHLRRRSGSCSQGGGHRNKQAENKG